MTFWRSLVAILAALAVATGCSGGSSAVEPPTTLDRVTRVIAEQAALYERSGVSHVDAACLADVTGRIKAPDADSRLLFASRAQAIDIDRCHISSRELARIGAYVRSHPPASDATTTPKAGMCIADPVFIDGGTTAPPSSTTLYCP